MKQDVQKKLSRLLDLTESIETKLNSEEIDAAVDLLKERGAFLNGLKGDDFKSALQSCLKDANDTDHNGDRTRTIIEHILRLDKQNMEVIKQKIEQTSDMIAELSKEQEAIKKWRVVARTRPKQIVDFLY
jgi:hypothetical protein